MSDRYQTISELSTGPAGTIYRGWDKHQNRDVSIQRIAVHGESAREVLREARALYGLRHPNIVTVYEFGSDEEGVYAVREMIKGKTLDAIINQRKLSAQEFDVLVRQSLEALHEAHTCGLIHRNLQPDTFLVPWNAQNSFGIKITDFTLCAPADATKPRRVEAEHFLAPEQFGNASVTLRADLYSLGALLYYSLTQRYPFEGSHSSEVVVSHLYHRLVPLSELRPDLSVPFCAWVERLMKREPAERPASAEEALQMYRMIPEEDVVVAASVVEEEPPALSVVEEEEVVVPALTALEESRSEHEPEPEPEPELAAPAVTEQPPARMAPPVEVPPLVTPPSPPFRAAPVKGTAPRPRSASRYILIAFGAIFVAVLVLVSVLKYTSQKERQQRLAGLAAVEAPEGSDLDVRMLLDFLEERAQRNVAAQVLSRLRGGEYIDEMLAAHVGETADFDASVKLIEIIGQRRVMAAFDAVLPLTRNPSRHMRRAAWQTLARITTTANMPRLFAAADEGQAAETEIMQDALVAAIEGSGDRAAADEAARKAYEAAKSPVARTVLLNVLMRVGGDAQTLALVTAAIADPSEEVRRAAIVELAKYPTHDPLGAIAERFPQELDGSCRAYLLAAAEELASKPGSSSQETLARQVQSLFANAKAESEKDRALNAISQVVAPSTVSFYEAYAEQADQRLRREALAIAAAFRRRLEERVTPIPAGGEAAMVPASKADLTLGGVLTAEGELLTNWVRADDTAGWLLQFPQNGRYEIAVYQAHAGEATGTYEVKLAGQTRLTTAVSTGNDTDPKGFVIGEFEIAEPGTYRLILQPKKIPDGGELMRVSKLAVKAL